MVSVSGLCHAVDCGCFLKVCQRYKRALALVEGCQFLFLKHKEQLSLLYISPERTVASVTFLALAILSLLPPDLEIP